MAGIDDVLERLITDPAFKAQLTTDPRAALVGYELTADDLSLLAQQVSPVDSGQSAVEQRVSKAGFFALFSQFAEGLSGPGGAGSEVAVGDVNDGRQADLALGGPDTAPGEQEGIIIWTREPGGGSEIALGDVNEHPGAAVGFNPQPDPPGGPAAGGPGGPGGSEIAIGDVNEQPGGGGEESIGDVNDHPGEAVGFNPQPDPPGGPTAGGPGAGGSEVSIQDINERPADLGSAGQG